MKRHSKILLISGFIIILLASSLILITKTANAPSISRDQSSKTKPAQTEPKPFDKTRYSLTDPNSIWVIVNKLNPLQPKTYSPADLIAVGNGQYMRKVAATAFTNMINDSAKQGLPISPLSGYRSYQTQVVVYAKEVNNYGQKMADSESARPGYSEHQTGLAVDVGGGGCGIEVCFALTKQGQWLAANAYRFGFIIRYTADKVAITGYRNEPWHIRYIGKDLAKEMHMQGIKTLEEFFDLPSAPNY